MKTTFIILAALCVALVSSHPFEQDRLRSEALDRLMVVEADNEAALRSKRTIGILRELFPDISQMIENKVNAIVAEVIRVFGPTLLRNFLGNNQPSGGGGTGSSDGSTVTVSSPFGDDDDDEDSGFRSTSSNGSKVSIALPTFPPDEDEDNETRNDSSTTEPSTVTTTAANADVSPLA